MESYANDLVRLVSKGAKVAILTKLVSTNQLNRDLDQLLYRIGQLMFMMRQERCKRS